MEDRLAKSLRAAHDRHAQHFAAEHGPHADHHEHQVHSQEHAPADHNQHVLDYRACSTHGTSEHQELARHEAPCEHHQAADPHAAAQPHPPAPHHDAPAAEIPAHHGHAPSSGHSLHAPAFEHNYPAVASTHPLHVAAHPAVNQAGSHPISGPSPASVAPAPASYVTPARTPESGSPPMNNRFSAQGGRISIVGTLVLSVLISTGLFSLQIIAKWRRAKPAETVVKAAAPEQPLTIATQDEPQPSEGLADASASAPDSAPVASPSPVQHAVANSEDGAQRSLDEYFAANRKDATESATSAGTRTAHAPYAPDPVNVSNSTARAAGDRTVMAPEVAGERPYLADNPPAAIYGQPPSLSGGAPANDPSASPSGLPSPPRSTADAPAAPYASASSRAVQPNNISGLYDHSGRSGQPAGQPTQATVQAQPGQAPDVGNPKNLNLVDWNHPASDATSGVPSSPPGAPQTSDVADAARHSLDAPGPVILPGRTTTPASQPSTGAVPSAVPGAGMTSGIQTLQADASPATRDPAQRPAADSAPASTGVTQTSAGVDPVSGLLDHRPQPLAAEATSSEIANPLAPLDRTKVMSFQFRNAPWTVVLAQFAAETHLELRMQSVPQGVFNRWDTARYSPSQTLAILNSELARSGCQLKLEGSVLRVCPLASALSQAAPAQPAVSPAAWLPQTSTPSSSGVVPASGRY